MISTPGGSSISSLNHFSDLALAQKTHTSLYPAIYRKFQLTSLPGEDEPFSSQKVWTWFTGMKHLEGSACVSLMERALIDLFNPTWKDWDVARIDVPLRDWVDMLRLWRVYDQNTRDSVFPSMQRNLQRYYSSSKLEDIGRRHDGFWMNCYGPLQDTEGLRILEKDCPKEFSVCLAHRLVEHGRITEAKKLIKRSLRFYPAYLFFRLWKKHLRIGGPPHTALSWWPTRFMYRVLWTIGTNIRKQENLLQILYRVEADRTKKLRILRKLINRTKAGKDQFRAGILAWISQNPSFMAIRDRPQQILKEAELRIDLYKYEPSKRLKQEIEYLLVDAARPIGQAYYTHPITKHWIITEFFIVLYYMLEHVYNWKPEEINDSHSGTVYSGIKAAV